MSMNTKAEMGIGTLIIFIALLLVAAIAAGVLIQTSGSLQEKALTTGDQAKSQISTNIRTIEVSASDGSNGTLTDFRQIVKLSPGSDAVKISQVLFTMNTYDMTGNLQYRGTTGTCAHDPVNGYYTLGRTQLDLVNATVPINLTDDYNDDGEIDYMVFNSEDTLVNVSISDGDGGYDQYLISGLLDCNTTTKQFNETTYPADVTNDYVSGIYIDGTCVNGTFPASADIYLMASNPGPGYFTVSYLQRGPNPVDGNLQRGDVIQLCYESPRPVGEDETVRLNFIPKIGTPTLTQFITPEVISTERVYLYP